MAFVSYDSYKNRIEKVAKFRNAVLKYKFLIIGVLAVIIAGITSLLVTKGMVTSAMVLPEQITYGEDYAPAEAAAFLSSVGYEYRVQGSDEWSEDKPLKVGKYSARTVTNKTVGKGYGEPVDFEILPVEAEFVIDDTTLQYGDDPENYALSNLVAKYGDRIDKDRLPFTYDYNDEEWTVDVSVGAGDLKIIDRNGNDSSNCYTYSAVKKTLDLTKRRIGVAPAQKSDTYTGAEFDYTGEPSAETKNILAKGDKITFKTELKQNGAPVAAKNAGDYDVEIVENSIVIVDRTGKDVTNRYDFDGNIQSSVYTVLQREITLLSATDNFEYDGGFHENKNYKLTSGELVSGHEISVTGCTAVKNYNGAGEKNSLTYAVTANGEDVTSNYKITAESGILTVERRKITVLLDSDGITYGDYYVYLSGNEKVVSEKGLVDGDALNEFNAAVVWNGPTAHPAVGSHDIACRQEAYQIVKSDGSDGTNNYAITFENGTLTVTRREINVTLNDMPSVIYGDTVKYRAGNEVNDNIVRGQFISVDPEKVNFGFTKAIPDVSSYDITAEVSAIKIFDGSTDVTQNYNIKAPQNGTLTVNKRRVNVTLNSFPATYGEEITYKNGGEATYNVVSTHTVTVDPEKVDFGFTAAIPDVDTYFMTCSAEDITISDGSGYVTDNYTITVLGGTLTVTPREITVRTATDEFEYDGGSHFNDNKEIISELKLADVTHYLSVTSTYYITEVDQTETGNNETEFEVLSTSGNPVNGNYIIKYENGTLTVTPRPITVVINAAQKTYDGAPLTNTEDYDTLYYGTQEAGLISGSLTPVQNTVSSQTDAGEKQNAVEFTASSNYEIKNYDRTNARLTVTPLAVTIRLSDKSVTYGDKIIFDVAENNYDTDNSDALAYGEILTVKKVNFGYTEKVPVVYKTYPISAENGDEDYYSVRKSNGADSSGNYTVTFVNGTLTITERDITIRSDDSLKNLIYNGEEQYYNKFTVTSGSLVEGQYIVSHAISYIVNVTDGERINNLAYYIFDENGIPVDSNYNVTKEYGKLTMNPLPITVKLNDVSATYGDDLINDLYKEEENNYDKEASDNLVAGETLTVFIEIKTKSVAPLNVGAYDISTVDYSDKYYVEKSSGEGSSYNYSVTFINGTLTITQRTLTVTLEENITNVYGDTLATPELTFGGEGLVNGDKLNPVYTYTQNGSTPARFNAGDYTVALDKENCTFTYGNGSAATVKNYDITVNNESSLEITRRPITVTLKDFSRVYGTFNSTSINWVVNHPEHGSYTEVHGNADEFIEIGDRGFAYEDCVDHILWRSRDTVNERSVRFKNVGEYDLNRFLIAVRYSDGGIGTIFNNHNFTATDINYDVTMLRSTVTLKITEKPVEVELDDIVTTYGDYENALSAYKVELNNYKNAPLELPFGEQFKLSDFVLAGGVSDYRLNASSVPYTVSGATTTVCDKDGNPIEGGASNYAISIVQGTLTVNSRTLNIALKDVTDPDNPVIYGGAGLSYPAGIGNYDLIGGNLAYGHQLEINVSWTWLKDNRAYDAPVINAGTYRYAYSSRILYDEEGNRTTGLTSNYLIDPEAKTAEILPLNIKFDVLSDDIEYNGERYYYPDIHNNLTNLNTVLPYNEEIKISVGYKDEDGEEVSYAVNAGTYSVYFKQIVSVSRAGSAPTNYEAEAEDGTLVIRKRKIAVNAKPQTVTYGEAIPSPEAIRDSNLLSDHEVSFSNVTYFYGDGTPVNGTPRNAGNYIVRFDGVEVHGRYNPYEIFTGNYDITVGDAASLTIEKRLIRIQPVIYGKTYDGEAAEVSGIYSWQAKGGAGFVYGDEENFTFEYVFFDRDGNEIPEAVDAGDYSVRVKDLGELDNYVVVEDGYFKGTFTISPRPIVVITGSERKEYNGKEIFSTDYVTYLNGDRAKPGLLNGDALEVVEGTETKVKDVDIKPNETQFTCGSNYEIIEEKTEYGTIEVYAREIVIDLEAIESRDYNGETVQYPEATEEVPNYTVTSGSLVDGEKLTIAVAFSATPENAGDYSYWLDRDNCRINGEREGVKNYFIHCNVKFFSIYKVDLTVVLNPVESAEYDGEAHGYAGGYSSVTGLVEGETLEVSVNHFGADNTFMGGAPVNAGGYFVSLDLSASKAGGVSINTNYNVTCEDVTYSINKRVITVTMGNEARTYNAFDYDYLSEKEHLEISNTLDSEEIILSVNYLGGNGAFVSAARNAGIYIIEYAYFTVNGGIADNYSVAEESKLSCNLTISPKNITVTVFSRTGVDAVERPTDPTALPVEGEDFDKSVFLGSDALSLEWEYTYYFGEKSPENLVTNVKAIGDYTVELKITGNADILNNYNITTADGTLEITARQVTVKPLFDGKVYDGEPINLNDVYYTHWHTNVEPMEDGFLENEDKNFTFTYYFNGSLTPPVNADTYKLEVVVSGYDEEIYHIEYEETEIEIEKRPVTATVTLGSGFSNLVYSHAALPTDITLSTGDFVQKDIDNDAAHLNYVISHFERGDNPAMTFAGNYIVRAEADNDNYVINNIDSVFPMFYVNRITVYMGPVGKTAKYSATVKEIALTNSPADYRILNGAFLDGDAIDITYSGKLTVPTPSRSVSIADVSVGYGTFDVTDCYDIRTSYDSSDPMAGESWYEKPAFTATLAFEKRTVYYTLITPDVREFAYDGTVHYLTKNGVNITASTPNLLTIVTGKGDGLVAGDEISVLVVPPVVLVGTYTDWARLQVKNGAGQPIKAFYDLIVDNADLSSVTVTGDPIDIDFKVTDSEISAALANKDTSVLSDSQYKGYYVLNGSKYTLTGTSFKHEVLVSESGEIKVIVFDDSTGSRTDKSITYSIGTVTGTAKSVQIVSLKDVIMGTSN